MITIKTSREIELLKQSNQIVAKVLKQLKRAIMPGVTTEALNSLAEDITRREGAVPAFKDYHGYPKSLCTSINNTVVHGIPGNVVLKSGDIIGLDYGVKYKEYFGDSAITVPVGLVTENARRLIQVTRDALYAGIRAARADACLYDISAAIQEVVESNGFSVVREFVGHGIGKELHEEPQVPNYGERSKGVKLKDGMVLAIEPMVNEGDFHVKILEDGWTSVTIDGMLSAHFEHSVAICGNEPLILSEW